MLAKTIRSLLNGGGTAAGVKGLRKAIAEIENELADHRRELDQVIPAKRTEAALGDDAEKTIEALRAREDQLYNLLEVGEVRLGRLRERLNELTRDDRAKDFTARRAAIIEASDRVALTIRAVHEAAVSLIATREAAASAGFASEVQQIPLMPFVVNIVDPLPLLDPFELAMAHYRETAPILRTPASPAPTGNRFGKTEFGAIADPKMTGGAAPHPVQLFQGAQDWQPPAARHRAAKAPASPAPPRAHCSTISPERASAWS